jgi:dTDP-4-amino-4,6-dideoxygalactose transaminase
MRIPFVDLRAQYLAHQEEFDGAFRRVIEKSAYIGGEFVRLFEQQFAAAAGAAHCVSVANGTDAIYVVLRMLGIGPGDEVITTAASWIATSETITQAGARPVFVDVDECFNLDPDLLEAAITPRTRAVLPVHLYGQAARMGEIADVCRRRGLLLIEDCAQAHLATFDGRPVGSFGAAATFSFYPGKNLGAYGDAGAIVTSDSELAQRCRMYANHGALVKHQHLMEGINSRLDGLQAALLSAKLPHLPHWTAQRRRVASQYDRLLAGIPEIVTPRVHPAASHVYHLYVVRAERRDALREALGNADIETAIHYPTALPLLPAYAYLKMRPEQVPNAARNQSRILSLPIYAEMPDPFVERVVAEIRTFYGR